MKKKEKKQLIDTKKWTSVERKTALIAHSEFSVIEFAILSQNRFKR